MATRAHSTTASASRRRPRQIVTPAALPKATSPRRADAGQPELPGPAALAEELAKPWEGQNRHDLQSFELRKAGKTAEANAHSIAADHYCDQALKLDLWMMVAKVSTPADAVAQLMVVHAKVEALAGDGDSEGRKQIKPLIDAAIYPLVVLAQQAGFDLARLGRNHLDPDQLAIARGEVPA